MYIDLHVKYPLFSSELKLELSRQIFQKNHLTSNFMKPRLVEAKFHAGDGWTGRDKYDEANSHFSRFCERARKALRSAHTVYWRVRMDIRTTKQ